MRAGNRGVEERQVLACRELAVIEELSLTGV